MEMKTLQSIYNRFCRSPQASTRASTPMMICLTTYLFFAILATLSLRLKNGRKFLNRVNFLLWGGCRSEMSYGFKYRFMELFPFFIFISFELTILITFHFILSISSQPILDQLTWFSLYLSRFSLVLQQHLWYAIGLRLKTAFIELNEEILTWDFSHEIFSKRNKLTVMNCVNFTTIKSAATRFSFLSLALKELNQYYGLFWLLDLSHLCTILIFLLSQIILDNNFATFYLVAIFTLVSAAKLTNICFLLGDASAQVRFYFIYGE
jgi:hypothetical protein